VNEGKRQKAKGKRQKVDTYFGEFICDSPEETYRLGVRFGQTLKGGEIILLQGELGAGKTLFVKGIAEGLDFDAEEVTSPSFTLVNLYEGRLKLYHLDLYRLSEGPSAAYAVDLDDLLSDEEAVVVIEWAERLGQHQLPSPVYRINITGDGDDPRTIKIEKK
jgi:tRNA threonylcarbamoyladenosine biosynthesis protein TsaE